MEKNEERRSVGRPKLADTDLKRKSLLLVIVCFVVVLTLLFTWAYKLNIIRFGRMKGEVSCAVTDIPTELKPNYQDPETGEVRSYGFTDPTFYSAVVNAFNGTSCSSVSLQDIEDRAQLVLYDKGLTNVDGIQLFKSLISLNLSNNNISDIDLSQNRNLQYLNLSSNNLTQANLLNNTNLTSNLDLSNNKLTELSLTSNTPLHDLDVSDNQLTTLDVYYIPALQSISADRNNLTSVRLPRKDITHGSSELMSLSLNDNSITSIDLTDHKYLRSIHISNNNLSTIDISKNDNINTLIASENPNLSNFVYNNIEFLDTLILDDCNFSGSLDLSGFPKLSELELRNNKLTSLNLSNDSKLDFLLLDGNELTNVNLGNCTSLRYVDISDNKLQGINLPSSNVLSSLRLNNNQLNNINLSILPSLYTLYIQNNNLSNLNLSANLALKSAIMSDNKLKSITLPNTNTLTDIDISNNLLESIDISNNKDLSLLIAVNNKLKGLNTSQNSKLTTLSVSNNEIENMDFSNNKMLLILVADNNKIETIKGLNGNTALQAMDLSGNKLSEINTIGTSNLVFVDLTDNNLENTVYVLKTEATAYESNVRMEGLAVNIDDEEIITYEDGVYTPIKVGETTQSISNNAFYEATLDIISDTSSVVGPYTIDQKIVIYDLKYGTYKVDSKNRTIDVGGIALDEVELELDSPTLTGAIKDDKYIIKDGKEEAVVYKIINYKKTEKDKDKSSDRSSKKSTKNETSVLGKKVKTIYRYVKKPKNKDNTTTQAENSGIQNFAGKTIKVIEKSNGTVLTLLIINTILLTIIMILLALHIKKKRKENRKY